MAISKSTRQVSTHASTRKGGARAVRVPDSAALVRFAETLKLRSLAYATQCEYLRFVRKLAVRHGGDPRDPHAETDPQEWRAISPPPTQSA